jgi:hypothetical protein
MLENLSKKILNNKQILMLQIGIFLLKKVRNAEENESKSIHFVCFIAGSIVFFAKSISEQGFNKQAEIRFFLEILREQTQKVVGRVGKQPKNLKRACLFIKQVRYTYKLILKTPNSQNLWICYSALSNSLSSISSGISSADLVMTKF